MSRRVVATAVTALLLLGAVATDAGRLAVVPVRDRVITVLLLGADAGPPRSGTPLSARADAFHLLFVSPDRRHATIVNVPRDAYVPVARWGTTRINACLNSGPENCVDTVESLWGVQVDAWVVTSMLGMGRAFEAFGGVEIDVDRTLTDGGPEITPGRRRLGLQALTYARDRKHRPGGDFDRTAAQAELLMAAHRELAEGGGAGPGSLMRAARIFRRYTISSMSARQLLAYAFVAGSLPPRNVRSVTLPGGAGNAGGASVVFLRSDAASIVRDAADGRMGDG